MSQSLVKNYLHIVFSNKNRFPWITPVIQDELFQYLGGICRQLESPAVQVGGYRDHVHILCSLSKNIALANFMREVKSNSSKWIKTKHINLNNFHWQNGYGAFSVNSSNIAPVIQYIANQEAHHKKLSFQKEYVKFLDESHVEYDDRYVWD